MTVRQLYDLRQEEPVKRFIARCYMEEPVPLEYTLVDLHTVESSIETMLDSMVDRGDTALVVQSASEELVGYALLTEHRNTWTGATEGFIYALKMERSIIDSPLMTELLEAIRVWGIGHGYQLLRAEVREGNLYQPFIERLQSFGWATSCLIPCKILFLPSEFVHVGLISPIGEDVRIRGTREEDYPFVLQLLAKATWDGLNTLEQSQLSFDMLAENIRQDFEPALRSGTALSFVAESAQQGLYAHATALIDCFHPFLDIPEAELVDVFVLPAFNGYGIGSNLTAHILSACLKRNIRFVRSTIVVENALPSNVQQVRTNLERAGWWINSRVIYRWLVGNSV